MGNSVVKRFKRRRDVKVLWIGLDGAGKSTLLNRLKLGKTLQLLPTVGYKTETLRHGNVRITCWDIGVRDRTRDLVKHYLPGTDCIVFVVDSTDRERLSEAFTTLLEPAVQEPSMKSTPILVLANKQDLEGAMDTKEIKNEFVSSGYLESRAWHVFGVSAVTGMGLDNVINWVVSTLPKGEKHVQPVQLTRSMSEPAIVTTRNKVTLNTHAERNTHAGSNRPSFFSGGVSNMRQSFLRR